ncbi:MAG: hypothetical protein QHH10_14260 [Peptococcaceae bacterium]|jgi:Flp pilus assembly protein TadB|nr:hypothetical protein [Peptococcaceae bacterium]MDH7526457.1 hypothetical protein [Peptococcaceae bacterium]
MAAIWSFLFPLLAAAAAAGWLSGRLFDDRAAVKAIYRAKEVIMSERELEKARENRAARHVQGIIVYLQNFVDLEHLVISRMRNMLNLMGSRKKAERELAGYVVYGLTGAIPVLLVPFVTGSSGYLVLYPFFAGVLVCQKYANLKKQYRQWQTEIIKDLPELIDKLRISFASGRDYISAFIQARDTSGPRVRGLIENLLNDLQYMHPAQALNLFAESIKMPAVTRFASAVKIAVEHGYESAENYFRVIEQDLTEMRIASIEELTKSKPEKVYQLYLILFALAAGSLVIKGWEIFDQVNKIM